MTSAAAANVELAIHRGVLLTNMLEIAEMSARHCSRHGSTRTRRETAGVRRFPYVFCVEGLSGPGDAPGRAFAELFGLQSHGSV